MGNVSKPVFCILLLLLQKPLWAQTDTAQKLLDRLTHWKTSQTYQLDFMFGYQAPGKEADLQRGTLYVKADRYRISMGTQEIYGDRNTETTFEKSGKNIVLDAKEVSSLMPQQVLRLCFLPNCRIAADGYDIAKSNIRLQPVKPVADFMVINIHFHPQSEKIQAIRLEQADGGKYHYFILNLKTGTDLSDEVFKH